MVPSLPYEPTPPTPPYIPQNPPPAPPATPPPPYKPPSRTFPPVITKKGKRKTLHSYVSSWNQPSWQFVHVDCIPLCGPRCKFTRGISYAWELVSDAAANANVFHRGRMETEKCVGNVTQIWKPATTSPSALETPNHTSRGFFICLAQQVFREGRKPISLIVMLFSISWL